MLGASSAEKLLMPTSAYLINIRNKRFISEETKIKPNSTGKKKEQIKTRESLPTEAGS